MKKLIIIFLFLLSNTVFAGLDAKGGKVINVATATDLTDAANKEYVDSAAAATSGFNVKDYGATGDGTTDDLVAIQATVDAVLATTTGGIVYFPPGRYSIDDGSITVANGGNRSIWFVGAGMHSSRIVKTTTGTGDAIIWDCTANPSGIQNLGIIADTGGNSSVDGITSTISMNGVFFENVWVAAFRNGFNILGSDIHLTNCISELNSIYGFDLDKNIKLVNCVSYRNQFGYILRHTESPAYPELPISLINCSDTESSGRALMIYQRDNVEIIGFTINSANYSTNVGIHITDSKRVNITGGKIRYLADYGIQLVGTCSEITVNGMQIHNIGDTTAGMGMLMTSSCSDILVTNCVFQDIRLSAIKTANSNMTRITNNVFRDFGRNETAGDKFGVLLDGDASSKGATVSYNQFVLAGGDIQTGISWESGAQGKFFIRANEYQIGTLIDLTNAPVGVIVESNQDDYTLNALANDATPSVKGRKLWKTGGTTTITDFDDGYEGKIFPLVSEHTLTITDGTNIFLSGSINFDMLATDTLTLIQKADGKWYELSRKVDSGKVIIGSNPPATAASTGTAGTITYDSDYKYVCVATDTWKRVAISTWAVVVENVIFAGENVIFAAEQVVYP